MPQENDARWETRIGLGWLCGDGAKYVRRVLLCLLLALWRLEVRLEIPPYHQVYEGELGVIGKLGKWEQRQNDQEVQKEG